MYPDEVPPDDSIIAVHYRHSFPCYYGIGRYNAELHALCNPSYSRSWYQCTARKDDVKFDLNFFTKPFTWWLLR